MSEVDKLEKMLNAIEQMGAWPYSKQYSMRNKFKMELYEFLILLSDLYPNINEVNFIYNILGIDITGEELYNMQISQDYEEFVDEVLHEIPLTLECAVGIEKKIKKNTNALKYNLPLKIYMVMCDVGKAYLELKGKSSNSENKNLYSLYVFKMNRFLAQNNIKFDFEK